MRVSDAEVADIAVHLELTVAAVRSRFVAPGNRLRDGLGTRCVFLEESPHGAACGIYPVRAKCRSWPFWPELLESPEAMAEAQRRCPGITPLGPEPAA